MTSLTYAIHPPFPQSEVEATLQRINGHKVRRNVDRPFPRRFHALQLPATAARTPPRTPFPDAAFGKNSPRTV